MPGFGERGFVPQDVITAENSKSQEMGEVAAITLNSIKSELKERVIQTLIQQGIILNPNISIDLESKIDTGVEMVIKAMDSKELVQARVEWDTDLAFFYQDYISDVVDRLGFDTKNKEKEPLAIEKISLETDRKATLSAVRLEKVMQEHMSPEEIRLYSIGWQERKDEKLEAIYASPSARRTQLIRMVTTNFSNSEDYKHYDITKRIINDIGEQILIDEMGTLERKVKQEFGYRVTSADLNLDEFLNQYSSRLDIIKQAQQGEIEDYDPTSFHELAYDLATFIDIVTKSATLQHELFAKERDPKRKENLKKRLLHLERIAFKLLSEYEVLQDLERVAENSLKQKQEGILFQKDEDIISLEEIEKRRRNPFERVAKSPAISPEELAEQPLPENEVVLEGPLPEAGNPESTRSELLYNNIQRLENREVFANFAVSNEGFNDSLVKLLEAERTRWSTEKGEKLPSPEEATELQNLLQVLLEGRNEISAQVALAELQAKLREADKRLNSETDFARKNQALKQLTRRYTQIASERYDLHEIQDIKWEELAEVIDQNPLFQSNAIDTLRNAYVEASKNVDDNYPDHNFEAIILAMMVAETVRNLNPEKELGWKRSERGDVYSNTADEIDFGLGQAYREMFLSLEDSPDDPEMLKKRVQVLIRQMELIIGGIGSTTENIAIEDIDSDDVKTASDRVISSRLLERRVVDPALMKSHDLQAW